MSFSKAKIRRFNDDVSCAPPPSTYNPRLVNKTIGPLINKTERFNDNRTLLHGESTESVSSVLSENGSSKIKITKGRVKPVDTRNENKETVIEETENIPPLAVSEHNTRIVVDS